MYGLLMIPLLRMLPYIPASTCKKNHARTGVSGKDIKIFQSLWTPLAPPFRYRYIKEVSPRWI